MIIVIIMALITVTTETQEFKNEIVVEAPTDLEELKELDEEVVPEMILDPNVQSTTKLIRLRYAEGTTRRFFR